MKFHHPPVKKRSQQVVGAIVLGIIALVGLPVSVWAAVNSFAGFEAETGAKNGNVAQIGDTSASGGAALKFGQSGSVSTCTGAAPGAFSYNPLNGRGWPTTYGQGYIATWKDDKIAATTLTIDDNILADQPWWKQEAQATGFKFTWFVITGEDSNGKLMTGATWDDFRALYALGNSIQSHTVTHSAPGSDTEFGQSQIDIQQAIGVKPLTLAYPDGDYSNEAIAAKYYIAARGTTGWLNPYKPDDYMDINSLSDYLNTTDPNNYNYAPAIIDKSFTQDTNPDFYRGWMSIHYHSIAGEESSVQTQLNWIKSHDADIWVGGFDHVAAYARERDVAQLSVTNAGTNCVGLNVTDTLSDTTYHEPLTVKIRLQDTNDWSSVSAQQNSQSINARIITNDSNKYALVDVVPDAGAVTVYNQNYQ